MLFPSPEAAFRLSDVLDEPVRGSLPDPALFSLPGVEIPRAYMRGQAIATPLTRLLGPRVTQLSSGSAVVHQRISPWLQFNGEFVDLTPVAEYVLHVTALTGVPAGSYLRTSNLSMRYLRPCTVENEIVIARGRILHAGSSFTTVEALFEDSLGRAIAHAAGSVIVRPMDPPPPELRHPLAQVDEPTYTTPDPINRPPPREVDDAKPPFARLIGAELVESSTNRAIVSMAASEWFCMLRREVSPGILAALGNLAVRTAILEVLDPGEVYLVPHSTATALKPVAPDGQRLLARGTILHRHEDVLVVGGDITTEDGDTVCVVQGTCLVRGRLQRGHRPMSQRVLLTVLFTDLVGSTERAQQLGDAAWRDLLDQHNALVVQQLQIHSGRQIKTTGDGILATFDSPTRAVRCASAIRDAITHIGLVMRAGVHTGECEVVGSDVAGIAVHVAARVQAAAQPGEVLVSQMVRELLVGSGVQLAVRGEHELKGLSGSWPLFAVED